MMPLEIKLHPAAVQEATEARQWYLDRSPNAALAFAEALDLAVQQLAEHPNRWAKYPHGTRHLTLIKFTYVVVYRVAESVIEVVAVAHERRRLGYWQSRTD